MDKFIVFISDLIRRLFSKKPQFFNIIQKLSIITGGLSATFLYIESLQIELPSYLKIIGSVNVLVGSVIATLMAQLPNSKE